VYSQTKNSNSIIAGVTTSLCPSFSGGTLSDSALCILDAILIHSACTKKKKKEKRNKIKLKKNNDSLEGKKAADPLENKKMLN
jgi:hypothetical protein